MKVHKTARYKEYLLRSPEDIHRWAERAVMQQMAEILKKYVYTRTLTSPFELGLNYSVFIIGKKK